MNRRALTVAAGTLAAIGALFVWAHGPLRSFVGDAVIVVFLVSVFASANVGSARARLVAIGLVSIGAELVQSLHLVGPGSHWLLHLTVGSTADPLDLVAYALGLGVAAGAERWYAAG